MPAPTPAPSVVPPRVPVAQERAALTQSLDSLVGGAEFRNAFWGILVVDPVRGDTLYARNQAKLFTPASNQKLLTSAIALTQLGADFTWQTRLHASGTVRDSVLDGNLMVEGRGDPGVSDHALGDAMIPLHALADSLRARGIRRITGSVLSYGDAFPGSTAGDGWEIDDLDYSYGAPTDELLLNEGFTSVILTAGARTGDPVGIRLSPPVPEAIRAIDNRLRTRTRADSLSTFQRISSVVDTLSNSVVLTGELVAGATDTIEVVHRTPNGAYLAALRRALADRGITVVGGGHANGSAAENVLVTQHSLALREVLPLFLKPSQNQLGELLFHTLALEKTGVGSADSARAVYERQLRAWGASDDGRMVRDGSGLSRRDKVSPETIIRVLDAMRRSPDFPLYYASLPIAGVDGTIRRRMRGTSAAGNVHAKTGTLTGARSLSGYVTTADGQLLLFSTLCNNYTVSTAIVDRLSDALAIRLASMRLAP
ncbi:MAG: D-alanyl-D-alanine carboxypeptidase/D-alanyl-D-alanine-endopeptidase [Gemmatimonadetes bacterium]|nr:D-alanyl-D-alanine carboxypeptidase/D-alanyl-D-alanine-endopeptidase [Gemmatimonadota bacterium]